MQPTVSPSEIWQTVDRLLGSAELGSDRGPTVLDSAFVFDVYNQDFVGRVRRIREHFWGAPEPPFAADEAGQEQRNQWIQNFNWRQKMIPSAQAADQWDRFNGELQRLSAEYSIAPRAVDRYIFFGTAPDLPPLRASLQQSASGPSCVEIRVFSSKVSGEELKLYYERLRSENQWPDLFYDRALGGKAKGAAEASQDQVRTWAVHCLSERAGLSKEEALKAWNERYPQMAGSSDAADAAMAEELRFRLHGTTWEA